MKGFAAWIMLLAGLLIFLWLAWLLISISSVLQEFGGKVGWAVLRANAWLLIPTGIGIALSGAALMILLDHRPHAKRKGGLEKLF